LLESIYRHLPVMVVILGDNGIVSYCNPAAARVTGYSEQDLAGKNFWATLFPGRLFAQVPRFISAVHPAGLLASDVAMVIRTKEGQERVVAWSRITQEGLPGMEGKPALVCFGTDLTDRLNACDTEAAVDTMRKEGDSPLGVGNAGTVDGEIVTPLAISPPILPGDHAGNGGAIQQVHEFLTKIEEHVEALETAFSQGEMACLAGIADGLRSGAHACGLLDFSTRAQQLHTAAARGSLEQVSSLVNQIVNMVRPDRGK
jgi:PAS domain S-box-containing protein